MVQTFGNLDLVLVNVQNIRGKHLASSIEYFLGEIKADVPMLIIASSPADLMFVQALQPPSKNPVMISSLKAAPNMKVKEVNRDRALAERQFCFAVEGLAEKSDMISRLVSQAKRTWWATRQSFSLQTPCEALAFEKFYSDVLARSPGYELELLQEAKRLILQEAENGSMREDRRNSLIRAALHEAKAGRLLVLARSDRAAEELKSILANYLEITVSDLTSLGIDVLNVFSPWPTTRYETSVACGYFGTSTVDMLFAGGAREAVLIVDPIEARVAIWDIEKSFCGVPDCRPRSRSFSRSLRNARGYCFSLRRIHLASDAVWRSMRSGSADGSASMYPGKPTYVCLCFADGSTQAKHGECPL